MDISGRLVLFPVSEAEKALLERIDGNRPLAAILAPSRDQRTHDVETLLLLISKGLLALIPPPAHEVG